MDKAALLALADRVERYVPTGHFDIDRDNERSLNEAIGLVVGVGHRVRVGDPALGNDRWSPSPLKPYVNSIDAAMTLVPEGLLWAVANTSVDEFVPRLDRATSMVGNPNDESEPVEAATPALALTAAALRAHASLLP